MAQPELSTRNGKIVVAQEPQASPELIKRISGAEGKLGKAKVAQRSMKQEISELELKLADNPIYQKILRLRRKIAMASKLERDAAVEVSAAYEELTKNIPGQKRLVDMFDDAIPDTRARKQLGKGRR